MSRLYEAAAAVRAASAAAGTEWDDIANEAKVPWPLNPPIFARVIQYRAKSGRTESGRAIKNDEVAQV